MSVPVAQTLTDVLDSAAAKLLEMADLGAKVDGAAPVQATLPERVKAFEAAVEWAKVRGEMPQAKEPSKFDRIHDQFRASPKRRGRPAEAPQAEAGGAVESDAAPVLNGSDHSVADDLFNS